MKVALFIGKEDISQAFIRVFNERFKSHFSEEWGIAFANFVVEPGAAPTGFNVTVYVKKPWVAVNVDTFKCEFTEEDIVLSLAFAIAKHFKPKKPAKWCKKFGFPAPRAVMVAHANAPLVLKRCFQAKLGNDPVAHTLATALLIAEGHDGLKLAEELKQFHEKMKQ